MQRLEVSDAVRSLYGSLGVKGLINTYCYANKPTDDLNEIQHYVTRVI